MNAIYLATVILILALSIVASNAEILTGQSADLVLGRKFGDESSVGVPSGVAVDPVTHKVFIADSQRHRVLRFSSNASLINGSAAEAVLGQADFNGISAGPAFPPGSSLNRMKSPGRLHIDSAGRLWVCDVGNSRVLRFDQASTLVSGTAANSYLGDGTVGVLAKSIASPEGITTDKAGNLYISDRLNHRVLRYSNATSLTNGGSPNTAFGQPSTVGGGVTANGTGAAQLDAPRGLCTEGDNTAGSPIRLYVADSDNNRIVRYDSPQFMASGTAASAVYGQAGFGSDALGQLNASRINHPVSLAVDGLGTLYIGAPGDMRILRLTNARTKNGLVDANGVFGSPSFTVAGGFDYGNMTFEPADLAIDGFTKLWVADSDHSRVLRFETPSGAANGAGAAGVLGDVGFTSAGNNWFVPDGVAVDPVSRKVFVLDRQNHRVLRYPSSSALNAQSVAEAVIGQPQFSATGNATTASRLNAATAIVVDAAGRLWIADKGNNRVLRFDNASTIPSGASANGVLGQINFTVGGSGGSASSQSMNFPTGLATGPGGRLWVADSGNNRVLRFENAAAKANGAAANGVLGQPDLNTANAELDAASLDHPNGLWEEPSGRLWVCDTANDRVLGWAAAGAAANGASASWVVGQTHYFASTTNHMFRPVGVVVDSSNRLFVANSGDHNVIWYDGAGLTPAAKTVPDGSVGANVKSHNDFGTSNDRFNFPVAIALDMNDSLFVADQRNCRVTRFLQTFPALSGATVAGGKFKCDLASVPGQKYDFYHSDNLASWTKESTVTGAAGLSSTPCTGILNPVGGSRFYRVQVP